MHINYYLYRPQNTDALAIYQKRREVEKALSLHSRYFNYTFTPKGSAEIKSKSISRAKLEKALQVGEATSFNMQNENLEDSQIIHSLSVQGEREFNNKMHTIDIHLPDCCVQNCKARLRILYPLNYLNQTQLNYSVSGIGLYEFIGQTLGEQALKLFNDELYKLSIEEDKPIELNNIFGKAGFLVSWWNETEHRAKQQQERAETRERRRRIFRDNP